MTVNKVSLDGQVNPKVSVHVGEYSKAAFLDDVQLSLV